MKTRGFEVAKFYECKSVNDVKLAFDKLHSPVVMKIDSKKHLHKTEAGGVILNISNKNDAVSHFKRLAQIGESVIIQEQHKGVELVLGVNYDDSFGRLIMFGVGGVLVELLKDVSFRVCPITLEDAEQMINELKTKQLLEGFRGGPKINRTMLKRLLVKLCGTAEKEKIKLLDLNPVIIEKNEYHIVDSRIEID
jgi:3-hydroxypropionyl-CoA synthetase (ADP-forming)